MAEHDRQDAAVWSAAVVGLGYAGLPTALALHGRCPRIIGIDVSEQRLAIIGAGCADLACRTGQCSKPPWPTTPWS